MKLAGSPLSSLQNQSTAISFAPNLCRAIRPGDLLSMLGFVRLFFGKLKSYGGNKCKQYV